MRSPTVLIVLVLFALGLSSCGETVSSQKETPFEPITYEVLFKASQFTEASTCGGCHTTIYQQWQGSMHNNAMEDRLYKGLHALGSEQTGGAIDAFCTSCHTPIGTFSGEVPPLDGPDISENTRDGVQCDFCHTVTDSTGIGNASFVFGPSDTKKGPFDDAVSPFHQTEYSELHTRSEFCGMCHDVNHPVNGVALEATYSEWKDSPYAEQGIQCQDCHMTPGPSVTKPNPGKAASMGPTRPHIYTHQFVGGNATELASEAHRQLAVERLQAAASLSLTATPPPAPGGSISLDVGVTNTGAGHYLPTGLTEVRQMWLEVTATDSSGKEFFHAGALDEKGDIDPGTEVFHTVFMDADGNETDLPWAAVSLLKDKRVPPMGTVTDNYSIPVPANTSGPLTIKATLHYRTAPQSTVDQLLGDEAFEVPVIDMASAETTVG